VPISILADLLTIAPALCAAYPDVPPNSLLEPQAERQRIFDNVVAFFAAFLLALVQGYGIGDSLEHMVGVAGEKVVINPGFVFFLVLILTLTAGTFLTVWIAELITKNGIGHGISILIFVGYGPEIFSNLPQLRLVPRANSPTPLAYFLLLAIIVVASTALIILMERSYRKIPVRFSDNVEAYVPLKFTSAGLIPAFSGVWLIAFPITVLEFMRRMGYEFSRKLIEALTSPGIWYYMVHAVTIFLLYYLFVSFFYDPRKIVNFLKNKQASIGHLPVENREEYIDKSLEFMVPIAALYLCVVVFAPNAILGPFFFFHIDSIKLITAVAVLLDLLEEMRARTKGSKLVKVAELHDVPMAGLLKSLFEQKGVPCYLRGYYHRALLYFFGPYIEISVLVPEDRMSEAKEVIETYLDANMLAVQTRRGSEFPSLKDDERKGHHRSIAR
jgi:preprotein translocase subunit SecY